MHIHADDLGMTRGITDTILECVDYGTLNSVSVMPTGYALDYAMEEYHKRSGLRLAIHLDLIEGAPVGERRAILPLLNREGRFHLSFQALWGRYLRSNANQRSALCAAVKAELHAQLARVRERLNPDQPIEVDSHLHFHMLPFVMDALIELREAFRIEHIRMPGERFFLCGSNPASMKCYAGLNLAKHLLLNRLTQHYRGRLRAAGITTNSHFVGVLFTGYMDESVVRAALSALGADAARNGVEILFHPGSPSPDERHLLESPLGFTRVHYSPMRVAERETVKSQSFRTLIQSVQGAG